MGNCKVVNEPTIVMRIGFRPKYNSSQVTACMPSAMVAATLGAGDRFMLQNSYSQVSELDIRRLLGSGFSAAVMQLEPGQWHGPVLSGFGVHLVYVYDLQVAPPPQFVDVRPSVLEDWQEKQQEKFNADFYEGLKSSYDIVISEVPEDRILDGMTSAKSNSKPKSATKPSP